jgi:predicted metalloprotease with PDZ domain
VPEDGVEAAVATLLGEAAARDLFDRLVRGTAPLAPDLEVVGLRAGRRPARALDDKGGTPPRKEPEEARAGWLGAELGSGGKVIVKSVREGSPAWSAGLYAEDEVVAESGFRADRAGLWDRMRQLGPGGTLRLTVFRRDELVEVPVVLGEPPEDAVWIEPVPEPTPAQLAAFEAWAGQPMPRR